MDLWERGLHAVLVGGTEVEGSAREGMFARVGEEEEEALDSKFRITVLSVNVCQTFRQATNRGGVLIPRDIYTKTGRPIVEVLWEKYPYM